MYQALYRKWRPRRFEDVVGQKSIVSALQNQTATGRVGHAYLFTGTRGTGKTTCAKIFAKAINCPNLKNGDPCGECPICKGIDDGSVLDVVEIDAASNNGVENIRDLRDETAYTPSVCSHKVYIIDEVHMLSIAAFNALLKIMEEPPAHIVFILATTEIHKVPATILSRCQRYDFGRIRPEEIAARTSYIAQQEQIQLTEGAAQLIGRLADGALRDALSILDTCAGVSREVDEELVRRMAGVTDKSYLFSISDALNEADTTQALSQVAQLRQRSVDMKRLCEELIAHYRNLMLAALPGGKHLLAGIAPEEEKLYLEKCSRTSQAESMRAIRLLGGALEKMSRGADQRIELELALFSITEEPQPIPAAAPVKAAPASPAPFAAAASAAAVWNTAAPAQEPQPFAQAPAEKAAPLPAQPAVQQQEAPPVAEALPQPPPEKEQVPLPWEEQRLPPQEVAAPPTPKPAAKLPEKKPGAEPEPFEHWPAVVKVITEQGGLLKAYLKDSKAYYDGRRVLIEGGNSFRDFIRESKDSQIYLKKIIEEVSGVHCGIGPYVPKAKPGTEHRSVQDTLNDLESHGVTVVYND